jgi:transcriptional antiterminator Rof (Rho-off)
MTDSKDHTEAIGGTLEGRAFMPNSTAEITEAVDLAFDYRGDVTLTLKSGESVVGYIFNRQVAASDSYLELFPAERPDALRISYRDIVTIAFTGEDTANGKSWEVWVTKKESERRAEAEKIEAAVRTQGYL